MEDRVTQRICEDEKVPDHLNIMCDKEKEVRSECAKEKEESMKVAIKKKGRFIFFLPPSDSEPKPEQKVGKGEEVDKHKVKDQEVGEQEEKYQNEESELKRQENEQSLEEQKQWEQEVKEGKYNELAGYEEKEMEEQEETEPAVSNQENEQTVEEQELNGNEMIEENVGELEKFTGVLQRRENVKEEQEDNVYGVEGNPGNLTGHQHPAQ